MDKETIHYDHTYYLQQRKIIEIKKKKKKVEKNYDNYCNKYVNISINNKIAKQKQ